MPDNKMDLRTSPLDSREIALELTKLVVKGATMHSGNTKRLTQEIGEVFHDFYQLVDGVYTEDALKKFKALAQKNGAPE